MPQEPNAKKPYAKKRLGQHFLNDSAIIHQIVAAIHPKAQQHVVEIGPGLGALTTRLLPLVTQFDAIELDRGVIPYLQQQVSNYPHFTLHHHDALTFDYASLLKDQQPLRLVGNLPYNIATELLFRLFNYKQHITDMHFMVQKEVAQRLTAQAGNKLYGRLSIMAQMHCQISSLFDISPHAFQPPPKVNSSMIRLTPLCAPPYRIDDAALFDSIIKTAFSQRRKTIRNSLKKIVTIEQLSSVDINPQYRAEQLTIADYVKIYDILKT
ncbi:MAG: 16S rRNA (adenine(1518)-N(6)/adenine(1519)-N(6))-dimethyltransferase RsmA [Gammaproteobacteria bacterium]|nr:16S rRNA (adenine(1518)-N(6)/adenine(1519)-N(6))-dimethyltransferase RsmA [Gammaproteobacteria bacterium]